MNTIFSKVTLVIVLVVIAGAGWWYLNKTNIIKNDSQTMTVSPLYGVTPLSVKITPPEQWQSVFRKDCDNVGQDETMAFGGREFVVNWGDGTITNSSNPKCGLVHTYQSAGSYTINAKVMDFSDTPVFDGQFTKDLWNSSANVNVSAK